MPEAARADLEGALRETEARLRRLGETIAGLASAIRNDARVGSPLDPSNQPFPFHRLFEILAHRYERALTAREVMLAPCPSKDFAIRLPEPILIGCFSEVFRTALYLAAPKTVLTISCGTTPYALRVSISFERPLSGGAEALDLWTAGGVYPDGPSEGLEPPKIGLLAALKLLQPYGAELVEDASVAAAASAPHRAGRFDILLPKHLVEMTEVA